MRGRRFWGALAGTVLVPAAVIGGVAVHFAGGAGGTGGASGAADSVPHLDTTGHFFLAVAVILAAAHLGGRIARRAGQPPVIGEICAGLALGPSLLGHFAPAATGWLFPAPSLRLLDGLAQLGLVLFVFGVGRELAGQGLRGAATQALLVSQASMLVPFAVGAVAATWLLAFAGPRADPLSFVLFVGCALSITALPVLARILADLDLTRTEPGRLALFAAAVGDGGSWLVLTAVLAGRAPLSVAWVASLPPLLPRPARRPARAQPVAQTQPPGGAPVADAASAVSVGAVAEGVAVASSPPEPAAPDFGPPACAAPSSESATATPTATTAAAAVRESTMRVRTVFFRRASTRDGIPGVRLRLMPGGPLSGKWGGRFPEPRVVTSENGGLEAFFKVP
ncbi:cation:proton antiporter [Streptomyces sp. ICC4]|uniref:cation:proton antiporter domain-containing protein n=1 Tax=Streptomyces sp. ICC4 TaxID=2099584 RepID=UPI0013A70C07|nr:cation:proton antiporter [Streptomyces sp. ICC4]